MFKIEPKPFLEYRKYYGEIDIPELKTDYGGSKIDFFLMVSQSENGELSYSVRPAVKNSKFISFRGKDLRLIEERVLEEIKIQKLKV